jgi:hypothetical protein
LIVPHIFSIGLRSGEYGGRNINWHWYLSKRVCSSGDLWNLALSRTTTEFGLRVGSTVSK